MENTHKSSIIIILLSVIFVMTIGYASLTEAISFTKDKTPSWNVHIKEISIQNQINSGQNIIATVQDDNLSANFKAKLENKNSSVTYNVTVKNEGTINAKLDTITFSNKNENIKFEYHNINIGDVIKSGKQQNFTVKIINKNANQINNISDLDMFLGYTNL